MTIGKWLAAAGTAVALNFAQPVLAADVVIRISHGMPETMEADEHAWAVVFKESVEPRSGGRIEVRILGNNSAGDERQQLERVQNGINQMCLVSEITQPFFFKPALVLGIPFLFPSSEVAWAVLDGPFGQRYNEEFRKATGVRILNHIESGFRSIFNAKKPIRVPADLAGMKLRTGENQVHMAMVRSFGANPTPIPWPEVYTSLQQRVVDGMENPPGLFYTMKFYEQQKYLTLNKHLYSVHTAMINEAFLQKLPEDLKLIVAEAAELAKFIGRSQGFLLERVAITKLQKEGIQVYTPTPAEWQQFRDLGQPPALKLVRTQIGDEWVDAALNAVKEAQKQIQTLR
jgi:TRAP-type transport system periplasmic protein